jgi:hypothetical protein
MVLSMTGHFDPQVYSVKPAFFTRFPRTLRILLAGLTALYAAGSLALSSPQVDQGLVAAARKAFPHNLSRVQILSALKFGLWNSNKTAIAVCIKRPKASLNFVLIRGHNGNYLPVDISGVELPNLGKIGIAGPSAYRRIETRPIKWLHRDDGMFQIVMQTRAWRGRKRFTVSEPLVIRADGTPIWR